MKKQLLFLFFALLALCASAAPNDVFSVGDITYSVTLDSYSGRPGIVAVKSLSAQGKAKTSLKLDIPGVVYYNGYKYKVGVINYDAFKGQSNISVVQIRYNITRIAQSAFKDCTSLTTVYMPSSLTNVGYHAFWGCNALKSVYYANPTPTSNSVITNAFPDNTNMTLYVSKAHTNSVENARKVQAFDYFSTIKKHVYASDFILSDHGYFCVTKAPLSDGSTRGEMSLVGVYADDNLNSSWSGAYNNGILDFDVVEIADSACLGNTGIKSVNLTDYSKLRRVGKSAFNGCTALSSVALNSSLLKIGSYAFRNCRALTSINLPASVKECSAYFVDGCSNLQTISVNGNNSYYTSIKGVLYNKAKTTLLRCPEGYASTSFFSDDYPSSITTIGDYAFESCKNIFTMTIPYGVTSFGYGAFRYCTSLKFLTIPSSVNKFGNYAFVGVENLEHLTVNIKTPPAIASDYFKDVKRWYLFVPHDAQDAYRQAPTWKNWLYIHKGASDFTVNYNTPSANYLVGYTITSTTPVIINGKAYAGKATVTEISFFDNNIKLPDGAEDKFYDARKNYAVTAVSFVNCEFPSMKPNTSITLGANIETIGERVFEGLTNLTEIKLNSNLKRIGNYAFQNSGIANDINLPYGLKICGFGVFRNTKVKHILVPSSVSTLGLDAFAENKNLEELIINKSSWASSGDWNVTGIPKSCKLYVPVGCEKSYRKNPKLSKLIVIEGAYDFTYNNTNAYDTQYHMTVTSDYPVTTGGVTYAGEAKYVYHPANMQLTSYSKFTAGNYEIDYTNGANKKYLMTEIGDRTLDMCSHIREVNIDKMKHLERIGRRAFFYTGIQKFTVPSTCVYIGDMSFASCQKLSELMLKNNPNRKWNGQFYGQNAAGFKCYAHWRSYYQYSDSVKKWKIFVGDTNRPIDRLEAYFIADQGATAYAFSVQQNVDWDATGLNAYYVTGYNAEKKMVYAYKVNDSYSGVGLLIDGFKTDSIYILKKPEEVSPKPSKNYLMGNAREEVVITNVDKWTSNYLFSESYNHFWRSSTSYKLKPGSAYLKIQDFAVKDIISFGVDIYSQAPGDINGDGEVNVSDVTALINKILGSSTYSDAVCDINGDGEINVSDVTALINMILK